MDLDPGAKGFFSIKYQGFVVNISPMKKIIGFGCLILSMLLYLLIFLLPFVDWDTEFKVTLGGGLYIASYVVMFMGGAVLGREIMDELKSRWKKWLGRFRKTDSKADRES